MGALAHILPPPPEEGETEPTLWAALRETGCPRAREALVAQYQPFARALAAKLYAGRHSDDIEFADYYQLAMVGLLESVDRFDDHQGSKFTTYAFLRIKGAILSGLEAQSERQQQITARKQRQADRVNSMLEGDTPSDDMQAAFNRLADIAMGLAIGFMLEGSALLQEEGEQVPDTAYTRLEMRQRQQQIHGLLKKLPEREQKILYYHYYQAIPFETIARMQNVTKGRISQLHKRALQLLRDEIKALQQEHLI